MVLARSARNSQISWRPTNDYKRFYKKERKSTVSSHHHLRRHLLQNGHKQHLFTLVSNLFHKALISSELGRSITTQALRDVFFIAKRSLEANSRTRSTSVHFLRSTSPEVPFTLPTWFRYNPSEIHESASSTEPNRPTYIFCRESVVNEIMKLNTSTLANVYATFFKSLREKGQRMHLVSKSMVYSKLTPPY